MIPTFLLCSVKWKLWSSWTHPLEKWRKLRQTSTWHLASPHSTSECQGSSCCDSDPDPSFLPAHTSCVAAGDSLRTLVPVTHLGVSKEVPGSSPQSWSEWNEWMDDLSLSYKGSKIEKVGHSYLNLHLIKIFASHIGQPPWGAIQRNWSLMIFKLLATTAQWSRLLMSFREFP